MQHNTWNWDATYSNKTYATCALSYLTCSIYIGFRNLWPVDPYSSSDLGKKISLLLTPKIEHHSSLFTYTEVKDKILDAHYSFMIAWALRVFNLLLLHFGQPNLHFWVLLPTQNYNQVILFISRLAIAGMYHSLYSPPATVGNRKNKRKDWAKTYASLGRWTFPQLFIGNKNYGNDYCRYLNICINTEWYTFNYSDFFSAFFFFQNTDYDRNLWCSFKEARVSLFAFWRSPQWQNEGSKVWWNRGSDKFGGTTWASYTEICVFLGYFMDTSYFSSQF